MSRRSRQRRAAILLDAAFAVAIAATIVTVAHLIAWAMGWWPMARWRVDIIRSRAEHLGTVIAANEKEAINAAIEIYEIEPARRNRITVTKISDKDDNEG
jgi:hypothetical protein